MEEELGVCPEVFHPQDDTIYYMGQYSLDSPTPQLIEKLSLWLRLRFSLLEVNYWVMELAFTGEILIVLRI